MPAKKETAAKKTTAKPKAKVEKKETAPKAAPAPKAAAPKIEKPAAVVKTPTATKPKTKSTLKVARESFYGTGKRKNAIAKVWLFKGKGTILLNDKNYEEVFNKPSLSQCIINPLKAAGLEGKYDIKMSTNGGGVVGQAYACQLGIARAILELNEAFRKPLREEGLLTRDSRIKERKKYGRKRARKGFQFRKR